MPSILITGAGGYLGGTLTQFLSQKGFKVFSLSTSLSTSTSFHWDPLTGVFPEKLPEIDIVINLAGENLSKLPWTTAQMERIKESRVLATRLLVNGLATKATRPRLFISTSAVGFYGDTKDRLVDESASKGAGFLSDVCSAWEHEAAAAETVLGCQTAMLRLGVVIGNKGGMIKKLLPIFRLGLGGKLGSGQQWLSWIAIEDVSRAVLFVIENETQSGPINFVAPRPVTNAEFTKELAAHVARPAIFNIPAFILRLLTPKFADEMLLKSIKVAPAKLQSAGFEFHCREIKQAIKSIS